jgi:putative CocE/NonD family hydrolase
MSRLLLLPHCSMFGLLLLCGQDVRGQAMAQPSPFDVAVPMRDGVELPTRIWKPGNGSYPVVLSRGYGIGGLGEAVAKRFIEAGYAYVGQQCRGKGGAEGDRFLPDDKDGYDCVEWIAAQPWCDGNVAMWGGSYYGMTCWRAAVAQPPSLKAIIPGFMDPDVWKAGYRSDGAIHLKMTTQTERAIPGGKQYSLDEWRRMLMFLPLVDMDREFLGHEDPLWNDYISHSSYDAYWKQFAMREGEGYARVRIPVYLMAGFRDYYAGVTFDAYRALRQVGATPEIRVKVDDIGHSGAPDINETVRWLDYVLKGKDNGMAAEPKVRVQVRNGGRRAGDDWPIPGTAFTPLYLSSKDGGRVGELVEQAPGDEPPTKYIYDPTDPCPTLGANGSHFPVPGLIEVGPVDQRPNEARQDMLVYTTPPLERAAEVVGPVEAVLHAASSARDTDFTVKLIDVQPDSTALNVTEGIMRTRFRESIWEQPQLIEPGRVYEYRVELLPVAIVFGKGHRIRIHVSSSNWPLWDRNQNTGNPIGMDAEVRTAKQTIYHDAERPSQIVLPLVPTAEANR